MAVALGIYAVGAALLAVWLDLRRPAPTLRAAFVHAFAAMVALQLVPVTIKALEIDSSTPHRLAAALVALVLPVFLYSFFALCRLLRVLAAIRTIR